MITATAVIISRGGHGDTSGSVSAATAIPAAVPSLGDFVLPTKDADVGQTLDMSGPVSGLAPGQLVWTFNAKADQPGRYYPNAFPCTVTQTEWTCSNVNIGPAANPKTPGVGLDHYTEYVRVIDSSHVRDILDHLNCNARVRANCGSYSATELQGVSVGGLGHEVPVIRTS